MKNILKRIFHTIEHQEEISMLNEKMIASQTELWVRKSIASEITKEKDKTIEILKNIIQNERQ